MVNASFSVYWMGSNTLIAAELQHNLVDCPINNALNLRNMVASLIGAEPKYVKVFLGSAKGPELTPVMQTLSAASSYINSEYDALKHAWNSVKQLASKVLKVYVTQHSAADTAITSLVHSFKYTIGPEQVTQTYNSMSDELRGNPKVAFVAVNLHNSVYLRQSSPPLPLNIPLGLSKSKQFVLQIVKAFTCHGVAARRMALRYAHVDLQSDEDFVASALSLLCRHGFLE